jgi:large subunit ribosomal protein L4
MKAVIYDFLNKTQVSELDLPAFFQTPFDDKFFSMHFARMKKAHHIPTNKTKNISEISGTTRKPHKQKGTGGARQGSLRSAQFRGGGIAFGPRAVPSFTKLPKSEVFLAKSMLCSEALRNNKLFFVNSVELNSYKTSNAISIFKNYCENDVLKVLIIYDRNSTSVSMNSLLAVRNLSSVSYVDINMLTVADLCYSNCIIFHNDSISSLNLL